MIRLSGMWIDLVFLFVICWNSRLRIVVVVMLRFWWIVVSDGVVCVVRLILL